MLNMKSNVDNLDYKIKYLVTIIDAVHKKFEHLDGKSNYLERQYKNVEESQNKAAKVTSLLTNRLNDMSSNVINSTLKNKNANKNKSYEQELINHFENVKKDEYETFKQNVQNTNAIQNTNSIVDKYIDSSQIKKKRGRKKKDDPIEQKIN